MAVKEYSPLESTGSIIALWATLPPFLESMQTITFYYSSLSSGILTLMIQLQFSLKTNQS